MLHRYTTYIISLLIFVLGFLETKGQAERWYLLKSIQPLSDLEVKNIIASVTGQSGISEMWFNGAKSGTFGVKDVSEIDWVLTLHELASHGYYLADITNGREHHQGVNASTSFYFQEAFYCTTHSDSCPTDYVAKLNQDEWDALPDEAKNYYLQSGNYLISE